MLIKNEIQTRSAIGASPVSLTDLKTHLRLFDDDTVTDAYLTDLILAALDAASDFIGVGIGLTSYNAYFTSFNDLVLPIDNATAIGSIRYYDSDNSFITVPTATYYLDNTAKDKIVKLSPGQNFPTNVHEGREAPVVVQYSAELVTASRAVAQAVLIIAADMYTNPESLSANTPFKVPYTAERLLMSSKRQSL